jgi:hypothetical protein
VRSLILKLLIILNLSSNYSSCLLRLLPWHRLQLNLCNWEYRYNDVHTDFCLIWAVLVVSWIAAVPMIYRAIYHWPNLCRSWLLEEKSCLVVNSLWIYTGLLKGTNSVITSKSYSYTATMALLDWTGLPSTVLWSHTRLNIGLPFPRGLN